VLSIFQLAKAGAPLSPIARAVLRFVDAVVASTLVVALPVISQLLASGLNAGAVDWRSMGTLALGCLGVALALSVAKWAKAHLDPTTAALVGSAATGAAGAIARATGLSNDVKDELDPSHLPDTPVGPALGSPDASPLPLDAPASIPA
jgi:hypothetical protein